MTEINFRASSIGKLMTDADSVDEKFRTDEVKKIIAKTKRTDEEKALIAKLKAQTLSVGAKTYIRELAAQEILGVDFIVSSKPMTKGIECEETAIQLLNNVRGVWLTKNTERRTMHGITGECDLYCKTTNRGYDIKCSFSAATFPILPLDCVNSQYEWQMRAYMMLWQANEWSVDYVLVDTPEHLIGYEPIQLHRVWHVPEHHRLTSWLIKRDADKEQRMIEKVGHAREYFAQVIQEFNETHSINQGE